MCGFVGWYGKNVNKKNIKKMSKTLKKRGPDSKGEFYDKNIALLHRRLSIIDPKNGLQPMKYNNYVIIYNGELYNTDEIKKDLISKGYSFDTTCDTEVLLKGYAQYKEEILNKIEGIFSFIIYDGEKIFGARDKFGVKPLFYYKDNFDFIFASEIKAILKSKIVKPIINKESLQCIFGLGPSRTPGFGIFKDIYEIKPAHYFSFKNNKMKIKRYWNIKNKDFNDTFEECKQKVKDMLTESIETQMVSDVGIATLLSGGLDSSIITSICALNKNKLDTYSIDYENNEKYFVKNDFQVDRDEYFIKKMIDKFNTNHYFKKIKQRVLAKSLKQSLKARDYPGMSDIDSSLYWFSKQIRRKHKVVLSGECADEIFGGYPWFYKESLKQREFFPWLDKLDERERLLKKEIVNKLNLRQYVKEQYNKTIKEVPKCKDENEYYYKKLFYLNMTWFMTTLLERKDRMTMYTSLEARVPFASTKLIEYLWNVPWEYKYYDNKEKGLLREAFKEILPVEVTYRKKNPYPKTHDPKYALIVCKMLKKCLKNKNSILYKLFDIDELNKLIETKGESYTIPWFGQLMTGPQLIAYLYQFDYWSKKYKIILEI